MNVKDLIKNLAARQIYLHIDEGRLLCRGTVNPLTENERMDLKMYKQEIINALCQEKKIDMVYPASIGQSALWIVYQLASRSPAYNIGEAVRIRSRINPNVLTRVVRILIDRHACLRSTFFEQDGKLFQKVHSRHSINLTCVDCQGWDESRLHDQVQNEYECSFDLEEGPVIRVTLFSCSEEDHVLLLNMHHIVSDGWSFWQLLNEMSVLYIQESQEVITELPPLGASYRDFAREQSAMLESERSDILWQFWKDKLSGELSALKMPFDRPRQPIQMYSGDMVTFVMDKRVKETLKSVSAAHGATLFMAILAAFQILLHKYSNQKTILVGTPVAGRSNKDLNVIGYFVNLLVMKADFHDNIRFSDFLGVTSRFVLDAMKHQEYPFPLLVQKLQPKRDISYTPLVQAVFTFQKSQQADLTLPDFKKESQGNQPNWEFYALKDMVGQFDIELEMFDSGNSLAGRFKYKTDLFDKSTITRMAAHFNRLVESIVGDPDSLISDLEILSEKEKYQQIVAWNRTKNEYPKEKCVHHLFEQQVDKHPDAVALICEDIALTYSELENRANKLAHFLISQDVKPNELVGICVERSLEMIVAMLGIMKVGGAYVPLDPLFPSLRLKDIITESGIRFILAQRKFDSLLPKSSLILFFDGMDDDHLDLISSKKIDCRVTSDSLVYVMFTSGSTGKPKGVQITHRNVVNLLSSIKEKPGFSDKDTLLSVTTMSFDISVLEFFLPLVTGGRLVIASRDASVDGRILNALVEKHNVAMLQATPATWKLLEETGWQGKHDLKALCGGEQLLQPFADSLAGKIGELWNMYGPTETTIWSTLGRINENDRVTIGRPLHNTQVYILDSYLKPVPVGVEGRLFIGGDGVSLGYLNRQELNREKFIGNPFERHEVGLIYDTGDNARYLSDGRIECLGRTDHQVKIRGFRIELGDIEKALSDHPHVRECAVSVNGDGNNDKILVASIVVNRNSIENKNDIRKYLKSRLPVYMIPSEFVFLDTMPLTPNRKIDRKTLAGKISQLNHKVPTEFPETDMEHLIASIWKEVLRLDHVGLHDNFFDVGGHSLLAARIQTRLEDTFKIKLMMVDLFQYSTIALLAQYIESRLINTPSMLGEYKAKDVTEGERTEAYGVQQVGINKGDPSSADDKVIAIIGMALRFPGSSTCDEFWENLQSGKETITRFSDDELLSKGVDPSLLENPNYIKAGGELADYNLFDAAFFNFTPREAEITDPQHRIFLECSWDALENAGYQTEKTPYTFGIYAGMGMSWYLFSNVEKIFSKAGDFYSVMLGNDKDFLATRVSYKLGLKGPSVSVQTACSTSLVAVHTACRALLDGECDIALAGGVSINPLNTKGYFYEPGMIFSPDGHCRAFDQKAQGTVVGNGAGVVVLKKLSDALADGDHIHSVIRGSAINNDGSMKVGFTAPSVEGQESVISRALENAGVEPDSVGYVETHGTGTILGDPIEIAALTKAFEAKTKKRQFCAIGTVKTNLGHLDSAAGIAGLIKTVLSLNHQCIPPSLHFEQPNKEIDFQNSPFFVNRYLREWTANGSPRRAGVSSFGIGGTNSHVILEEAPERSETTASRSIHLLVMSAKTKSALIKIAENLADYLKNHPDTDIAAVAYTLQVGRRHFPYRSWVVCRDLEEAVERLSSGIKVHKILGENLGTACDPKGDGCDFDTEDGLVKIAEQWLNGAIIDFNQYYLEKRQCRIPLPSYPFEKLRYSIESIGADTDSTHVSGNIETQNVSSNSYARPELSSGYAPPQNDYERILIDLWQSCMGIKPIGIIDDFFELGGDSLMAVRLISRINKVLNTNLDPHVLMSETTVKNLAGQIEKRHVEQGEGGFVDSSPSLVVEIQKGKENRPNLFMIHPVGGHVYIYRDLAMEMGSSQSVYGIQAQGVYGDRDPLETIEEMASQYIEEMRKIQREGPYFIGGSSFGGIVAFEMNQQLNAMGQDVAMLAMIDSPGRNQMPVDFYDDTSILEYFLDVGMNDPSLSKKLKALETEKQMAFFIEQLGLPGLNSSDQSSMVEQFQHFLNLFKKNMASMRFYEPKRLKGKITYLCARERDAYNAPHPERAWENMATRGIELFRVPGNHITMHYKPNAKYLAERIEECINLILR